MNDIKDIVAAFETHHMRAAKVITALVPIVNKAGVVMTLLSEQHDENAEVYLKIKADLVEGIIDIAEIMDGLTGDYRSLMKYHMDDLDEILKVIRGN